MSVATSPSPEPPPRNMAAAVDAQIFPCGPPRALSDNLWQVEGTLKLPIPRNMTIWRSPDGRLVLYSVIAMHEEGMHALELLGTPAYMVIPHLRHHMDAPFYKARYPKLRVLAEDRTPVNGVAIDGGVHELAAFDIHAERIPGTSGQDIAMDLPITGGRALCVCELLGNITDVHGVWKLLARLAGPPGGGFGVARAVRLREVRDRQMARAWLAEQSRRQDLRMVLVGHGAPIIGDHGGVSAALARAATQM
jgi:hypothetical protein